MGETTEKVSASVEQASSEEGSAEEPKEWIEQAQDEADRQAQEVEELPEQPY